MAHPEPEDLLRLVDGAPDDLTRRHVDGCAQCRSDLATMTRARAAGATLAGDPTLRTLTGPPREIWDAIQDQLDEPDPPAVTPESPRSRRVAGRRTWVLVAASVVAGAILGGTAVAVIGQDGEESAQATRTSALQPLEGHATSGTLAMTGNAPRESLSVDLHEADPGPGFLEVWLLDAKTGGMVSLGVLDGERGTYAVPAGLDLSAYDQVDVSREPYDGNPAHSKVSLARGPVP